MLKLSETKIEKSYTTCSDTDRTNILSICRQTSVEVSFLHNKKNCTHLGT